MFTGLVQALGQVAERKLREGDLRLTLAVADAGFAELQLGESIAINGCCLTVVEHADGRFAVEVSRETLDCTTLGDWQVGRKVNLERALRPSDRLGGHFVSGHVDGVGRVLAITADGHAQRWRFELPAALRRYLAVKGSITVDGVSLTVNAVDAESFAVALIPHTLQHTAFQHTTVADPVHLEVDLLARYLERLLEAREAA